MNRSIISSILLGISFGILMRNIFPIESNPELLILMSIPGTLFLWGLRFVSVPILFSSIFNSIQSLEDSKDFKKYIRWIFPYFVLTTFWSVGLAFLYSFLLFPNFIQLNQSGSLANDIGIISKIDELFKSLPKNNLDLFLSQNYLSYVVASIFLSLLTFSLSSKYQIILKNQMELIYDLSIQFIRLILKFSPYAILFLLSYSIYKLTIDNISLLMMYILVLLIGYISLYFTYSILFFIFSKSNPIEFFSAIYELLILAFSTSSSSAVLPKTIEIAENKLNIQKSISNFVLPLGTTINMDGTAYFQATATLFLASYYHILLDPFQLIIFFFLIVAISIGTSAIPGVGIVLLTSILSYYGIPIEGIGLILGIDRLNDMIRTTINVTGDLIACIFLQNVIFRPKN
jgi:Na+/H+-dicarboxylate symporter